MDNYTILEVTEKVTGKKIKIKGYRFNPELHSDAKTVGKVQKIEKVAVENGQNEVVDLSKLGTDESPVLEATESPVSDEVEEVEVSPDNYCKECDKAFKRAQDLKTHVSTYHK